MRAKEGAIKSKLDVSDIVEESDESKSKESNMK